MYTPASERVMSSPSFTVTGGESAVTGGAAVAGVGWAAGATESAAWAGAEAAGSTRVALPLGGPLAGAAHASSATSMTAESAPRHMGPLLRDMRFHRRPDEQI